MYLRFFFPVVVVLVKDVVSPRLLKKRGGIYMYIVREWFQPQGLVFWPAIKQYKALSLYSSLSCLSLPKKLKRRRKRRNLWDSVSTYACDKVPAKSDTSGGDMVSSTTTSLSTMAIYNNVIWIHSTTTNTTSCFHSGTTDGQRREEKRDDCFFWSFTTCVRLYLHLASILSILFRHSIHSG